MNRLSLNILIAFLTLLTALPCAMAQGYKLGDVITNEDGSRGVVFYVRPDGSGGWMVALNDASTGCPWGVSGDIPALTNQDPPNYYQALLNDTDGYGNTEKIRAYQNNSSAYAAGKVDFEHGWYLPSAGQLTLLCGNLSTIEGAIAAAGGTTLSANSNYWTSTENTTSNAWFLDTFFRSCSESKTNNYSVRAIHDFGGGQTIVYDTTLNYYWNTGATTPYINVSPTQTTTYTVTAVTEFGCSATAEQTVYVNPSGTEHVYDTVCAGYAYEGYGFALTPQQTQTQGEATFSREIGSGECTATLTLHLYKRGSVTGPSITASTCENEAYYYNGYAYSVAGTYHQYYTAASGCDSIVTINLSVLPVSSRTIERETCNSLIWNGETYTESGTYEQTLQNQHGCDSVVTMYLTVNHDITHIINDTTCGTYTWNGHVYTESGQYTESFAASTGCDSIVILNLTINDLPLETEWEHQACNSFEWNGTEYTATGDYEQTFESVQGCDSIVTLHLTINDVLTSEWEHQACDSFVWNGTEYTATGDYTQTFESVQGCDSIVTLHLTINDVLTSEWEHQACNSFEWNGTEYTATGDYEQTFESVQGCDSIVTLHLTINDVLTSEWEHQACDSFEWNGTEYTATGDYEQTFESVQGCDSIVTLHFELVDAYEVYLDTVHCGAYWFDGHEIETSGYYEGQFVSSDGCDSTVYLQLTVERFPDTPIMEGQENVFVATDLMTGIYHYEAASVPDATHYEWLLTGADWLMDTIGTSCTLMVIYPGTAILTLRAWNECGYSEVQKTINAGYFDVSEQEAIHVNVYPNPTRYKTVVESEGIMRIRMYSMKGQLLQEINGNGDDRVEVNLRDFAPAPYLLEVMTRNGVANVKVNVVR